MSTRVLGQLVRPVRRTLPWRALGAAGAVGLLLAVLPRLLSSDPTPRAALVALRAAGLVFALGLAFVLDDPARELTAPVATRRMTRTALRVALAAPVAALWWTAALLLVPSQVRPPAGDITLEAAAAAVLSLAASSAAVRLTEEAEPGQRVAGGLLVVALAAPVALPDRWAFFVTPDDRRWDTGHDHWALVLLGAAVLWATCGPEPLGRRSRALPRPTLRPPGQVTSPSGTSSPSRTS